VTREDGLEVEWRKGRKTSGAYRIGDKIFDRTNGEVPPEIKGALPMLVEIDGQPFMPGFQRQHDRPFMFGDTPRWRAQALGEFDGSNTILLAETRLRQQQRSAQGLVKVNEERLTALTAEHATLAFVTELGEAVAAAEAAQEAAGTAYLNGAVGRTALASIERSEAQVAALEAPLAYAEVHLENAAVQLSVVRNARGIIDRTNAIVEALEVPSLAEIEAAHDRYIDGRLTLNALEGLEKALASDEAELFAVTEKLAEFKVCPVCGKPL
jgi:hypothetical protein